MSDQASDPKRTAVLVVHGMGSQRPMDTARGVIEAVWLEDEPKKNRKFWAHPELSATDVDLMVFTNSPEQGQQRADFHELYWAHLLSETKAVAVLLWLFELGRRGPRLNERLIWIWRAGAAILAALLLSLAFLALHLIDRVSGIAGERQAMIIGPLLTAGLLVLLVLAVALQERTQDFLKLFLKFSIRIAICAALVLVLACVIWVMPTCATYRTDADGVTHYDYWAALATLATVFLPVTLAILAAWLLMRGNGIKYVIGIYLTSIFAHFLFGIDTGAVCRRSLPWSLDSTWSAVGAWSIVGLYLALHAAFLQPYFGDAARYFRNSPANVLGRREIRRQAVETLEQLHLTDKYNRIIVVAHSLGSVIAYDMLRAYFGRVYWNLPANAPELKSLIDVIEEPAELDPTILRKTGREIVRKLAEIANAAAINAPSAAAAKEARRNSWLVTDFVTMGSPLTHAAYLMIQGDDSRPLQQQFDRHVEERQYPTCPPKKLPDEQRLTFFHKATNALRFHHGAVFGLTRWTNLYFPMSELLWGDAIGGKVGPVFKDHENIGVVDVEVSTERRSAPDIFTHNTYWDTRRKCGRKAPHILWLRRGINLEDRDAITPAEAEREKPNPPPVPAAPASAGQQPSN